MIGFGRGGGGFSGFPYRSAHQQGQDGRGNNRGGRNRGRGGPRNRQPRPVLRSSNSISIAAELDIPSEQRRIIVGRGGTTLKWLKEVSGANIFVPRLLLQNRRERSSQQTDTTQSQQHSVRVSSSDLTCILHAFYEISYLLSTSSDTTGDFVPCCVKMKINDNDQTLGGKLFLQSLNVTERSHCLFSGSMHAADSSQQNSSVSAENPSSIESSRLRAYSIETSAINAEAVATIIDNIQFVHSSVQTCRWHHKEALHRNSNYSINERDEDDKSLRQLIFVFGRDEENPRLFIDAICEAITAVEINPVV